MKTWILDIIDEACGMVRYSTAEVKAETLDEAIEKWNTTSKGFGPGYFATGGREKDARQQTQEEKRRA